MAEISLSFDNGPNPEATPRVLDSLARRGILATFFLVCRNLDDPAALAAAEAAHAAGHWIGNHTMTHDVPLGIDPDPEAPQREIAVAQAKLGALAHPEKLFRPFAKGELGPRLLSQAAVDHLCRGGYTCVLWTHVPGDFDDHDGWPDRAMAQIAAAEAAGRSHQLIVLHDAVPPAMRHLDAFLDRLADADHSFRQDHPPDCVPIRRGDIVGNLEGLVAG
ncbi:polysaccharide deacetylase family protein [Marinibaculum pumilum]|uniref:Chitooligosaccharide deacetylase n=1 Tax=Marinibaculum pumilum TaxID=1766165 RepID=A0ABV7L9Q4_9PROT